jgi:sterol 3beta-glucosyltransferase
VPQIILPFGADQFFWAGRVAALGIGPRSSARLAGNATALAGMIDLAQEDSMRRKARELGKAMACEDGVSNAASRIETLVTPP